MEFAEVLTTLGSLAQGKFYDEMFLRKITHGSGEFPLPTTLCY